MTSLLTAGLIGTTATAPIAQIRVLNEVNSALGSIKELGFFEADASGGFAAAPTLIFRPGSVVNARNELVAKIAHYDSEGSFKPEGLSVSFAPGVDIVPVLALLSEYEAGVKGLRAGMGRCPDGCG